MQIFVTDSFKPLDDFSTYQEILHIPGNAASLEETYNIDNIRVGRYIVIERQDVLWYLEMYAFEVYAPEYVDP